MNVGKKSDNRIWRMLGSSGGQSLVELIVVMVMLSILGTVILSLMRTGGTAYKRIHDNFTSENEARIALSYITIKIRQSDTSDAHAFGGVVYEGTATPPYLRIQQYDESGTRQGYWDIWHDAASGRVMETKYSVSGTVTGSGPIAENIRNLVITPLAKSFEIDITYDIDGQEKHLKQSVYLRSD